MPEHKPIYEWSLDEAVRNNERELWRESQKENCDCARAIERAIADAYDYEKSHLNDCAKPVIEQYGFDRVNWVLANTVQEKKHDGRFSEDNKLWARKFRIPADKERWQFSVDAHPGLTDIFIIEARKAWQALGLFEFSQCEQDDHEQDYTGKVVALRPDVLKDEFKTPEEQLFLVDGGNGARPHAIGRKVYGKFLKDGEETHFFRSDILGVLKDEFIPEWVNEKLAEMQESEQTEFGGMEMQ